MSNAGAKAKGPRRGWRRAERGMAMLCLCALAAMALSGCEQAPRASREFYEELLGAERDYIYSCQASEGAILTRADDNGTLVIDPYASNIAVMGLLEGNVRQKDLVCASHYFEWYGTQMHAGRDMGIPDGVVPQFSAIVEGNYLKLLRPQVPAFWDANAASYLMALGLYGNADATAEVVSGQYGYARQALAAITSLVGQDGLTRASDEDRSCYLVNNLEVAAGLYGAVGLYDSYWIPAATAADASTRAQERETVLLQANALTQAIVEKLWDAKEGVWYRGLDPAGEPLAFGGWDEFDPAALTQLAPLIYTNAQQAQKDGVEVQSAQATLKDARALYDQFCEHYAWQDLAPQTLVDGNYVPSVAYAAAAVGDSERVQTFIKNYQQATANEGDRDQSIKEAGWLARVAGSMMVQLES